MSGLDSLLPLIDNGGTRSGSDRRQKIASKCQPERRSKNDRRCGADRRRVPNSKREEGKERRSIFYAEDQKAK